MRSATRLLGPCLALFFLFNFSQTRAAAQTVAGGAGTSVVLDGLNVLFAQPESSGKSLLVAQASVTNRGSDFSQLRAVFSSRPPNAVVMGGQLDFGAVASGATSVSKNVIVVEISGGGSFDPSALQVTFDSLPVAAPVASAGINRRVMTGQQVTLSGTSTISPTGNGLQYLWNLATRPEGSGAGLRGAFGVINHFVPDVDGSYVAQLVAYDGSVASAISQVTIGAAVAAPPSASAEVAKESASKAELRFSGARSSDPNAGKLEYKWDLLSAPAGSVASIANDTAASIAIKADQSGEYTARLVVDNGSEKSTPSTATAHWPSHKPQASAGRNQKAIVGKLVRLDGSGSTDADGRQLAYNWSLLSVPSGSSAKLSDSHSATPVFVADRRGTYVAQLIVMDGQLQSDPRTVIVDSGTVPPTANAGPNQLVAAGAIAQLDASGSTDLNGLMLSYQWSLVSVPQGSNATLSSATDVRPTFAVDLPGTYMAQLFVNDSLATSAAAQAIVSTTAIPPIANAGPNQLVAAGAGVTLDGSGSTDPNGLALSYSWSLISVPQGSQASLSGAQSVNPTFTADLAGNYVAQLIVSDANYSSAPASVLVTTSTLPPTANPGSSVAVSPGSVVNLNGGGSTDPQGLPLTFNWALLSIPGGSAAVLSNPTSVTPTFTADLSGIYIAQLVVNDGVLSSAPVTVVINGLFPAAVTVSLFSPTIDTFASTGGDVHISNPATNTGGTGCAGQIIQIALDNGSLGTLSTPNFNPATSVCIPMGLQDAPFTLTSNGTTGSTTLSGFAQNFQTGTASFTVNVRQVTMFFDTTTVGQGRAANGTLVLTNPAPAGGATFNLSSSQPAIATVSVPSVSIAAGATTATFQINAQTPGQSLISAGPTVSGYVSPATTITVLSSALSITIPKNLAVGPGQTLPFPVSIGAPATSPVTVTLTATSGPGSATFTPSSVTIPTGGVTPPTQPTVTGGALGQVSVTASAPGYAPDLETVSVQVTLSLAPPTLNILTGNTNSGTLTLSASQKAPTGGLTVSLTLADPTIASVPATVTIPSGASTVKITVVGLAQGSTTLTAGGTGYIAASSTINVSQAPPITLSPNCPASVGFNSVLTGYPYTGCYPYLGAPAPAGGLTLVLKSSDATKLTLTLDPNALGSGSVSLIYAGGSTTPSNGPVYFAGLMGSGSVNLTASLKGYFPLNSPITLTPSGFVVYGGTSTTTLSPPSTVSVYFANLDPQTLAPTTFPSLRAGASAATIGLANDNTVAGKLGATSVTITSGIGQTTTTYTPHAPGTSNISVSSQPTGYTMPSSQTTTQFVVTPPPITLSSNCPKSVGFNSVLTNYPYTLCYPYLGAPAPAGGVTLTMKSTNAAKLTLTLDPTLVGTSTVTLTYAGGSTTPSNGPVYFAGLANSGSVNLTATAKGYTTMVAPLTLTPSGFTVFGGTTTTTLSPPSTVYVYLVNLDPVTLTPTSFPSLRVGAAPAAVTLANDNTVSGKLGATTVKVTSSSGGQATTTYTPHAAGTSNITVSKQPAGYAIPSSQTTTQFVVTLPPITLSTSCPASVGFNSVLTSYPYYYCYPYLGAPAPAGGVTLTLKSTNAAKLTLTLDPTIAGGSTVSLNYAAGSTTPTNGPVYFAGLASSGTVNLTSTAKGYATLSSPIKLTPSGFIIQGGTSTTTLSPPSTVYVYFVNLDPQTLAPTTFPDLRATVPAITVNLTNDNTGTGTLGSSSVSFVNGSNGQATTTYTPVAPGTSNIGVVTPSGGYATSSSQSSTQFVVTPPPIAMSSNCPTIVGFNSILSYYPYTLCYPYLGAPAPAGGVSVNLTTSDPSKLTLTLDATHTGNGAVTLNYPAGSTTPSNGPVYFAGLASGGSVLLTATAPGFSSGTLGVALTPSGFTVSGGTTTTSLSPPSTVYVNFAALDSTSLSVINYPYLRPGLRPVTVSVSNDNTSVGSLGSTSVTLTSTSNGQGTTTFTPISPGVSNVKVGTPTGYRAPFNQTTTQFVVVPPPITFSSNCPASVAFNSIQTSYPYTLCYPYLGAPAPAGGVTLTLMSSDATKLTLTTNPAAVGSGTVTLQYPAGSTTPSNGPVYFAGLAKSGFVNLTATAPGFTQGTISVNLTPSGFVLSGGTSTTTLSPPSTVYAYFAALDPVSLNAIAFPNLRPGAAAVTVNLSNDNTTVGTLGANSVVINAASNGSATTTYTPLSAGTSNITAVTPAGYTKPFSGNTTQFVVSTANIVVEPITVGKNMMATTFIQLATGAPTDNFPVTVMVDNSTQLLLSSTGQDSGLNSLTFTLSQGQTQTPPFWVYALGSPGTSTMTLTASGYNGGGTITIDPSGFIFDNSNFSTTVNSAPTTIYVQPAALDPVYLSPVAVQQLQPGMTNTQVTITLTDQPSQGGGASKVGSITINPVVFNGADNPNVQITSFQPIGLGQTLLQLTSPGYSTSSSEVTATVTQ